MRNLKQCLGEPVPAIQVEPQTLQDVHDDAVRQMRVAGGQRGDAEVAARVVAGVGFVGVVGAGLFGGERGWVCISLVFEFVLREREREGERENRVGGVCIATHQRFIPRVIRLYERGQRLLGAEDRAAEV